MKAELLLECLNVIKEYKDSVLENSNKGTEKPPLPIIMTAFNVKTPDDYLLEIIKRIRSRYDFLMIIIITVYNLYSLNINIFIIFSELEEVLLLIPFSSVCYFMESMIPLLHHMHHEMEPVIRSLNFLVQTLHKPLSSVKDMLPVLKQLHILATQKTNEFRVCTDYSICFNLN